MTPGGSEHTVQAAYCDTVYCISSNALLDRENMLNHMAGNALQQRMSYVISNDVSSFCDNALSESYFFLIIKR